MVFEIVIQEEVVRLFLRKPFRGTVSVFQGKFKGLFYLNGMRTSLPLMDRKIPYGNSKNEPK